ncbi:MAG: ABC transporter permease [Chloroflexi bacterium]|nr:MAG: ABC transporter permease [Chloroflexota bacterium]TME47771.1 MAG: ABC transporter permease [Chloroflexota bacterium]TMF39497.1 MAG: ABC transporter permease [Chloroflexota bacterium]
MTALTGTFELARSIVRRDRIRILVWIGSIVVLAAFTAAGTKGLFPSQAALDQTAAATQHNAAAIAFNGPAQGLNTVGGQVAFQFGAGGMVLVALMSLFMVGRLTRGEEEAGRLELVRSLPVGSHAPAAAATLTVAAMSIAVGLLTIAVLLTQGLPAVGSIVFGVSFILIGLFFAGVALLVAQVTENTRVVYGTVGGVLGAAFVLRAVGDIGDGTASWFSPIGWAQKARPFAGERWWPFLLMLAATAVLVAAAMAVAARRDLGAGLVAARLGKPTAARSLGHPFGLAIRLQRGVLFGWAVGVLVAGIAYGWIGPTVDTFIGQNKALAEILAGAGGASLTDSYFAASFRLMALVATGFAIQSALRLRSEETSMRAESVLATPISRTRWAASHLTVAFAGSVILLGVAGLATGLTYGFAGGDFRSVPRLLGAALVYAPPMWLMVGLTIAFVGLVPRWVGVSWAILAVCVVVGFLGAVLHLPSWLQNLSPFERVPQLPAASLTLLPLFVISTLAAALTLAGLGGLRRRDIGWT